MNVRATLETMNRLWAGAHGVSPDALVCEARGDRFHVALVAGSFRMEADGSNEARALWYLAKQIAQHARSDPEWRASCEADGARRIALGVLLIEVIKVGARLG